MWFPSGPQLYDNMLAVIPISPVVNLCSLQNGSVRQLAFEVQMHNPQQPRNWLPLILQCHTSYRYISLQQFFALRFPLQIL